MIVGHLTEIAIVWSIGAIVVMTPVLWLQTLFEIEVDKAFRSVSSSRISVHDQTVVTR